MTTITNKPSNQLSITLQIAGKVLGLTIKREEEELFRKAEKMVNEKIRTYKQGYSYKDEQELHSMVHLDFSIELLRLKETDNTTSSNTKEKLIEIDSLLSDHLA